MPGKSYTIGGITLVQEPLVLGQLQRLGDLLEKTSIDIESTGASILQALGSHGPLFLAHVLRPEGVSWKEHVPEDIINLMESLPVTEAIQVVEDFFDLNEVSALLEKMNLIGGKMFSKQKKQSPPATS
jgi:hypothetical protein